MRMSEATEDQERKRAAIRERKREWKRHRYATDPAFRERARVESLAWYHRRYPVDPEFRKGHKARSAAYRVAEAVRELDRIRAATRRAAARAERQPDLFNDPRRPGVCTACGAACKPEAHHADYRLPLDVEWLCRACHGVRHRRFD